MSDQRAQILGSIRRALKRGPLDDAAAAELEAKLKSPRRNLVPARATQFNHRGQVELFVKMAEAVQTSVARVASAKDVPGAVADYLARLNLPQRIVAAPDPQLDGIPWAERPLLAVTRGVAGDSDPAGITACFAAIAETGTLMLLSGPESPTRNNFLPDTHIVVLRQGQVTAAYEDGFARLRAARANRDGEGGFAMPRNVNFITGPSRTADIEQRIELGAHGPRRLHIVLIEDGPD
ncbi:MAG TPA: lactate utilization protein [Stellaceae bacterium]|nr:lactate utilization protein [Stellaceae bacterium]